MADHAAGGTTAGRRVRGEPEGQRSFCLLERAEVDYLVSAPRVSICGHCIRRCVAELERRRVDGWRRWWDLCAPTVIERSGMPLSPYRDARSCSFCRQSDETLVAEHAQICSPCVWLARDVVAEAGRPPRGEGG